MPRRHRTHSFDFDGTGGPTAPLRVELRDEEAAVVARRISEVDGGHQKFLRELHAQMGIVWKHDELVSIETFTLQLYPDQLATVEQYTKAAGGHQDRFRAILRAAWRAGWQQ